MQKLCRFEPVDDDPVESWSYFKCSVCGAKMMACEIFECSDYMEEYSPDDPDFDPEFNYCPYCGTKIAKHQHIPI